MSDIIDTAIKAKAKLLANDKMKHKNFDRAKMALRPKPGFAWNPLCKLPRNSPCPCKSGRKFKVCCLSKLPEIVKDSEARQYQEAIETGTEIHFNNNQPSNQADRKDEK